MTSSAETSPVLAPGSGGQTAGYGSANLADILERVLDRGLVVAGDIRVNLLDIELLTIKLRLVIASLETAKRVGMSWWEHDPWYTGTDGQLREENERLRAQLAEQNQPTTRRRKPIEAGARQQAERELPESREKPVERRRTRR